jgi:cytochrome c556
MTTEPSECAAACYAVAPALWERAREQGYILEDDIREALRYGDACRRLKPYDVAAFRAALETYAAPVVRFAPKESL